MIWEFICCKLNPQYTIKRLRFKWKVFMSWEWKLMGWLVLLLVLSRNLFWLHSAKYFVRAVHKRARQEWLESVGCQQWVRDYLANEKSITIIEKEALLFSWYPHKLNPANLHILRWGINQIMSIFLLLLYLSPSLRNKYPAFQEKVLLFILRNSNIKVY